jgi:ATP-dependent exoDNAse (exonuclease V) beta subunit
MTAMPTKALKDDAARRDAISSHDRSLLIEAGAGSGKTAILAGRIAMMLAEGVAPKSIAAVTFTELAASELLQRVREFVNDLASGEIPPELRIALSDGLSAAQRNRLITATAAFDDITCSTIHGFCQRLIAPYPVEANIDPGAAIMDRNQADLAFAEIVDAWLREKLPEDSGGLIAEMVLQDPGRTVELIRKVLANLRRHRDLGAQPPAPMPHLVENFARWVAEFSDFIEGTPAREEETAEIARQFADMATAIGFALTAEDSSTLVRLLRCKPNPDLCTQAGSFRAYKKKGKWVEAAKRAGLAKADAERLNTLATTHYEKCGETWASMLSNAAGRVLVELLAEVRPAIERFQTYKRSAAFLDFDDLLFAARDLLHNHDDVRRALASRYTHVLVDEFQDTDPLQTEIFWRLCGDAPPGVTANNWVAFRIRPGALFLVGDPKQAIYRFRGADVLAYVRAREAFRAQDRHSILSIATNFRSCSPILTYVNERFETVLSSAGQPGFTALDPFHGDRKERPCVAALDVPVSDESGKPSAEQQRDAEADAVAELCTKLIGREIIVDRKTGQRRPCRPGDIGLLAPTGTDLWRYEEALEHRGIPVATQAGKGLFRRQEIQDLIALTRVLANSRDRLALGALLRGPLVGLTEEELLDIIWALPRPAERPDALPRLDLNVDPQAVAHPLARDILEKLQSLRRRSNSTTPHELLSQAVDVLRVRPILLQRHRRQAERALANVDLYLSLTRGYSVRGLRALAEAMTLAWGDESRAVEGRPDAQEEAVALYTIHAAKGLEWPIVVPVNTMTSILSPDSSVTNRENGHFFCPVFGVEPIGYEEARAAETAELNRERIRLWYVAATRARELLILPRLNIAPSRSAWIALLDLSLAALPALEPPDASTGSGVTQAPVANAQTREIFVQEAARIAEHKRTLIWSAPSRDEGAAEAASQIEASGIILTRADGEAVETDRATAVQGGRERGLVIHKLLEEVLIGETAEDSAALEDRAAALIQSLGKSIATEPINGLSPAEIAGCVERTLKLPPIAALRPTLLPELPVYASDLVDGEERVTAGITDAISLSPAGTPEVVIDWKSDVSPSPKIIEHYCGQVREYLRATGAASGLIVFVTSGSIVSVQQSGDTQALR